jgi:hypothetical protein
MVLSFLFICFALLCVGVIVFSVKTLLDKENRKYTGTVIGSISMIVFALISIAVFIYYAILLI